MSLPRYPAYKDSGVTWLGEVPGHWDVRPVKAVASCNDEVLDEFTPADYEIEYVEISGVDAGRGITSTDVIPFGGAPSRARRRVQDGDVLVSTVRTYLRSIAPINNPPDNMIASTGFAVVRPRMIKPHFLGYLFQAEFLISEVIARSVGVSYPAINASDLMRLNVPIPFADEQSVIAAFLDRETGKIDALVAEQENLIQLLREKRQAVISHAVTKGINPAVPMKDSGIEWLGEVPEHWQVKRLKYVGKAIGGLTYDPSEIVEEGCGMLVLRSSNVQNGRIVFDDNVYVTTTIPEKIITQNGDILVCSRNGSRALIGKNAMIDSESSGVTFGAFMMIFRSEYSGYIFHVFNSQLFKFQSSAFLTATINQLTVGNLYSMEVPLPPVDEQLTITAFLNQENTQFDTLTAEAQRGIELLKERRSALISAAVTGKIDVRNVGLKPDLQAVTGKIDVH
jgi:type I restriction enzyme S subunit